MVPSLCAQAGVLEIMQLCSVSAVSRTNNAGTKDALTAANITRTTGEVICRSPPEYHFPVGIGIWCGVSLFGVAILLGMYRVLLFNFWVRL